MVNWLNNVIATMVFFIVYLIVYYLIAKEVTISLLVTSVLFFSVLVLHDIYLKEDE